MHTVKSELRKLFFSLGRFLPSPLQLLMVSIYGSLVLHDSWFLRRLIYSRRTAIFWKHTIPRYEISARKEITEEYRLKITSLGTQFREFVGPARLCLDAGCGTGMIGGKTYDELGYKYWPLDCLRIGVDPLLTHFPRDSVQAIVEALPFRDGVFDCAISATSLDHFLKPKTFIQEAARVTKKNGSINIWVTVYEPSLSHMMNLLDLHHVSHFSRNELYDVVKGFNILGSCEKPSDDPRRTYVFLKLEA